MKYLKQFEGYAERVGQHGFNVASRYTADVSSSAPYQTVPENEEDILGLDIETVSIDPNELYCIPQSYYESLSDREIYKVSSYDKESDNISVYNDNRHSKIYRADNFKFIKFDIKQKKEV